MAVSDWMRAVPDQVARWIPGPYISLGTDGYGLSDTREALRAHFAVDVPSIVATVRQALDAEPSPRQAKRHPPGSAIPDKA